MAITPLQDTYGRYVTAPESDFGIALAGGMVVCVFDPLPTAMWCKRVRVWGGKNTGTNATLRTVVYDTDTSKNPTTRMAYGASQSVTTSKTDASGGASYEANLDVVDVGPASSTVLIPAGTRPAVGFLTTVGDVNYSMKQAASITADNEQFYQRSGLSQPPPSSIGAYSPSVEGHISAALVGEFNVAPLAPASLSPSGSVSSITPSFTGSFRDWNGSYGTSSGDGIDRGDKLVRYEIQVRRVSDGVSFWGQYFDATSGERSADAFTAAYAGTTLVRGTAYEWRARCKDEGLEYGAFCAWTTFTPSAQGTITLYLDPTGAQQVISGVTLNFDGKWTHVTASNLVKAQVRLYDQGTVGPGGTGLSSGDGTLVDTSPEITLAAPVASSAAPGTAFEVLFADCGFTLAWGKRYGYSMRGQDALGNWSDYTSIRTFNTDDPPSVPTAVLPNGTTTTAYPLITCQASDDDDTVGTGLVVSGVITRPDTSTVTVAMTYDATLYGGAGGWKYQTSAVEITAVGTYTVACRSYDGTVYSGGTTVLGSATYSSVSSFIYAVGPTVTFVTPLDGGTVLSSTPTIAWTTSTVQVQRRVVVTNTTTGATLIDEGWVTTAVKTYQFPVGGVTNGLALTISVSVIDVSALTGLASVLVTSAFTPPASLANVSASTTAIRNDPWDTAIRVRWDQSALGANFGGYLVRRRYTSDDSDEAIIIAMVGTPSVTEWIDAHAPAGDELTYSVSQYEAQPGGELIESARVEVPIELTLYGFAMVSVTDTTNARLALRFVQSFEEQLQQRRKVYEPLSGADPISVSGSSKYLIYTLEAIIVDELSVGGASASEIKGDANSCKEKGGTFSIRDDAGLRAFVTLETFTLKRRRRNGWILNATFRTNRYVEAASTT